MANRRNATLYTGVTNQIWRRVREHKAGVNEGFTKKYSIKRLVYYEVHGDINRAIRREKTLKNWPRKWKLSLIGWIYMSLFMSRGICCALIQNQS
jgi:putative endonuclease